MADQTSTKEHPEAAARERRARAGDQHPDSLHHLSPGPTKDRRGRAKGLGAGEERQE